MALASLELDSSAVTAVLDRLVREDVIGQLLERRGRMAGLATEAGDVKLDWIDQVAWALGHPEAIEGVEKLAESIRSRFAHVVWSGMGGSVQAVHTLKGIGVFGTDGVSLHPIDSTDPAALNRLLRELAPDGDLDAALKRTLMVGVSMGMTSEEPITHLRWFEELLRARGVERPAEHVMVMTLPGSLLDHFAEDRGAPRVDIQLDGRSHIAGRMSAPSTRVFLLPAALGLAGQLQEILRRCQAETKLQRGMSADERRRLVETDPFVRLAAWLSVQLERGRDMLVLDLPRRWAQLGPWVEQVVEESLGKEGRGLLVFHDQDLGSASAWPDRFCILQVDEGSGTDLPDRPRAVLRLDSASDPASLLGVCARCFSGWNLAVALVGYLQGITFAGQPAVEHYKSYARRLRDAAGELPYPAHDLASTDSGRLELFSGAAPVPELDGDRRDAGSILAAVVRLLDGEGRLGYFDLTVNGDSAGPLWDAAERAGKIFGNHILERPTKVRSGPRDYHSTEQSETAGPPDLLSLRVLVQDPEPVVAGEYSARFLHAQALGTLFAMRDAGRPVLLATVQRADAATALVELLEDATARLGTAHAETG
jgi:glucose-6-phosphate isomerase